MTFASKKRWYFAGAALIILGCSCSSPKKKLPRMGYDNFIDDYVHILTIDGNQNEDRRLREDICSVLSKKGILAIPQVGVVTDICVPKASRYLSLSLVGEFLQKRKGVCLWLEVFSQKRLPGLVSSGNEILKKEGKIYLKLVVGDGELSRKELKQFKALLAESGIDSFCLKDMSAGDNQDILWVFKEDFGRGLEVIIRHAKLSNSRMILWAEWFPAPGAGRIRNE